MLTRDDVVQFDFALPPEVSGEWMQRLWAELAQMAPLEKGDRIAATYNVGARKWDIEIRRTTTQVIK